MTAVATSSAADGIAPPRLILLVEDLTHRRVLYRHAMTPGRVLVLSYVHSSEHVVVRGTLVVEPDGALLAKETACGLRPWASGAEGRRRLAARGRDDRRARRRASFRTSRPRRSLHPPPPARAFG
jgi:hypothetical protein